MGAENPTFRIHRFDLLQDQQILSPIIPKSTNGNGLHDNGNIFILPEIHIPYQNGKNGIETPIFNPIYPTGAQNGRNGTNGNGSEFSKTLPTPEITNPWSTFGEIHQAQSNGKEIETTELRQLENHWQHIINVVHNAKEVTVDAKDAAIGSLKKYYTHYRTGIVEGLRQANIFAGAVVTVPIIVEPLFGGSINENPELWFWSALIGLYPALLPVINSHAKSLRETGETSTNKPATLYYKGLNNIKPATEKLLTWARSNIIAKDTGDVPNLQAHIIEKTRGRDVSMKAETETPKDIYTFENVSHFKNILKKIKLPKDTVVSWTSAAAGTITVVGAIDAATVGITKAMAVAAEYMYTNVPDNLDKKLFIAATGVAIAISLLQAQMIEIETVGWEQYKRNSKIFKAVNGVLRNVPVRQNDVESIESSEKINAIN